MNWNDFLKCSETDHRFTVYDSIQSVNNEHWEKAVSATNNIYLSRKYLVSLEQAQIGSIEFRYILFYDKKNEPIAAAVLQLLSLEGSAKKHFELLNFLGVDFKNSLTDSTGMQIILCGNIFACGENGFAHTAAIGQEKAFSILANALNKLSRIKSVNKKAPSIVLKEFWPYSFTNSDSLEKKNFSGFMIDANMTLPICWNTFDDYLLDMITKFRTKAKSVFIKSEALTVKDFSKENIAQYKAKIEELYFSVVEKADFNVVSLNGDAFYNFKKNLKDHFFFKGYFLGNELIGFSSAFVFNRIVDACHVGLDYTYNQEYALYQRMLYDYADLAITSGSQELRLGRTAEEIKSSIGAEPVNMKLYAKHNSKFFNKLLKPIIKSISPSKFELRKPFKHSVYLQNGASMNTQLLSPTL